MDYQGEPPKGEEIGREDWEAAFTSMSKGAWKPTKREVQRELCRRKERERGVVRLSENLSIVPGSLVEELRSRLDAGENVIIHCGRVITLDQFLHCASKSVVVEIAEGENGGDKVVTVDGVRVKGVPTGESYEE
jgi:hypothetical protein